MHVLAFLTLEAAAQAFLVKTGRIGQPKSCTGGNYSLILG